MVDVLAKWSQFFLLFIRSFKKFHQFNNEIEINSFRNRSDYSDSTIMHIMYILFFTLFDAINLNVTNLICTENVLYFVRFSLCWECLLLVRSSALSTVSVKFRLDMHYLRFNGIDRDNASTLLWKLSTLSFSLCLSVYQTQLEYLRNAFTTISREIKCHSGDKI